MLYTMDILSKVWVQYNTIGTSHPETEDDMYHNELLGAFGVPFW